MSSSGASSGSTPGALSALQNGVLLSTDLAISAISINAGTGALSFTLAAVAQFVFVKSTGGAIAGITFAGGAQTPAALTPATPNYAVVGVELTGTGAVALVKGADTATQLNTAALIASNTPAVTSGRLRLYDFAIQNNAGAFRFGDQTTIATQGVNWIDRRPWARGSFAYLTRTQNAAAGNDYTTTSTTYAYIDQTNISLRLECTGVPVQITLAISAVSEATTGAGFGFSFQQDGVGMDGMPNIGAAIATGAGMEVTGPSLNYQILPQLVWTTTPSAGSHVFSPAWCVSSSTGTLYCRAGAPLRFSVDEQIVQVANNGSV